jgi:hypothetical protein
MLNVDLDIDVAQQPITTLGRSLTFSLMSLRRDLCHDLWYAETCISR